MPPHKSSLSYKELASHDDFVTDMMIDHVWFWTTIRKNHSYYKAERLLKEEHITSILKPHLTIHYRFEETMRSLERLPAVQKYLSRLASDTAKDHFRRHLEKYVQIYMPNCPFEITTTNRYMITEHEASITARKPIKKGDVVKYLCGLMVNLTPEEEAELDMKRRAFSIVLSSRKKTMSLFLGPARLANHDCDPNAKLNATNSNKMEIVAKRDIEENDEITVSYGDDYFGEDNCECLCATCETNKRNGWAADAADRVAARSTSSSTECNYPAHSTRLQKRMFPSDSSSSSRLSTPDICLTKSRKKTKLTEPSKMAGISSTTELTKTSIDVQACRPGPKLAAAKRKPIVTVHVENSYQSNEEPDTALLPNGLGLVSRPKLLDTPDQRSDESDSQSALAISTLRSLRSPKSSLSTPASSVFEEEPTQPLKVQSATKPADSITPEPVILPSTEITHESLSIDATIVTDENIIGVSANNTPLGLPIGVEASNQSNGRSTKSRLKSKKSTRGQDPPRRIRIPGDYMTDKSVLTTGSKKLKCETCRVYFIQPNAYEPHVDCPRCERHSKLYGFPWPKSEREGEHDREMRITDHRQINRVRSTYQKRKEEEEAAVAAAEREEAESSTSKKGRKSLKDAEPKTTRRYGGIWKDWKPPEEEWAEKLEEVKKANRYKRTKKVKTTAKVTITNAKKPNGVRKMTVTKTVKVSRGQR